MKRSVFTKRDRKLESTRSGIKTLRFSPRVESLEQRQLMAVDVILEWNDVLLQANADAGIAIGDSVADYKSDRKHRHNGFDPEDVNNDGEVNPLDALSIINCINAHEDVSPSDQFLDVNDDNEISPLDALQVINRLNGAFEKPSSGLFPLVPIQHRQALDRTTGLATILQIHNGEVLMSGCFAWLLLSTVTGSPPPEVRTVRVLAKSAMNLLTMSTNTRPTIAT
jgi:hypothetical protein